MTVIERRAVPHIHRAGSDRERLCLRDREAALRLSDEYGPYDSPSRSEKTVERKHPTLSPGVGVIFENWRVSGYGDFDV